MIKRWAAAIAASLLMTGASVAEQTYTLIPFEDLNGWADDDHDLALKVFRNTCADMSGDDWVKICAIAMNTTDGQSFFEAFFQPVVITDGEPMLFTGYFEPELRGSLKRGGPYQYPLYRLPNDHKAGQAYLTRRQIEEDQRLAGRGLEIAWIDNPVDVFFLQVQGSGRVKLAEGGGLRVGYGGKNGHEYSSIGQELIARGIYEPHQVSAQVIRNWVKRNPVDGRQLLWKNDSYVFFREVSEVPAELGPLGAMNRSITTGRSIAVDPKFTKLGTPVWIEKEDADPIRRLMIAQDTGSAIKGAQRADIFYGTGDQAGRTAGRVRDGGRMVTLLPIQSALALLPDTIE